MAWSARTAALAVAMACLVALAGCGSSGSPAASPSPTVSASAVTQWAGSVCSSVQTVQKSIKNLNSGITIKLNSSQGGLSLAKQQLKERVSAVLTAASGVASTVASLPPSADQQVKAAQQQLKASSGQTEQAVQKVKSAATNVQAAGTPAEYARNIVAVGTAAAAAATDVGALHGSITKYASSTRTSVKNAFGSAPSYRSL
jgi:hypothetical protein